MRKRRQYQIKNFNMYDFNDFNFTIKEGQEINLAENQIVELIQKLKGRKYNEDGINPIPELIFVETGNKVNKDHLKNLLTDGVELIDRNEIIENENMNGKKYVRLVRSSSMARNGTIAFIQEDLKDKMMELISLGKLKHIDKAVISKLESYLGLAFSTTMFIDEVPENVCIVDSNKFKVTINDYVKTVKDNKVVQGLYDVEVELFDGQGLHTPEYGKKVSDALRLNYIPTGYQIRLLPSIKGMSFEIDFKSFYKEKGIEYIEDYTGKKWKVEDLDCIWTTSMFKFSKHFNGWGDLKELREKYYTPLGLNQIGISSYSENKDNSDKKSKMTYQYLQSLALVGEDLIDMSNYTKNIVTKVYSGDLGATMIFLGLLQQSYIDDEGNVTDDIDEENMMSTKIHYAISKNPDMISDSYVQSFLQRQLAKTINNAKLGKIYIDGQYSFVCQDPVAMLEMIAGLEGKGSLEKNEFYSTGVEGTYAGFRSPLTHSSEARKLNFVSNEVTNKWLNKYKNIVVFNGYDITAQAMGNADFDGDRALFTNDSSIVSNIVHKFKDGSDNYVVVDIFKNENRAKAEKKVYSIDNIIEYDMKTLENKIGEITNIATYYSNKGHENLKEYDKEIVICRLMQGEEIDYCKHGIRTIEVPDNFSNAKKYKPYFLQKYKYSRDKNIQQNVVNAPLNILCRNIEQFEKELYKKDKAKIIDTTNILIDRELINEDKEESKRLYNELKNIYANYKKEFGGIYLKCRDKHENYRKKVYDNFYDKYHAKVNNLSHNKELLSSLAVHLNYIADKKDKSGGSYLFPWIVAWEGLTITIDKTAPATVKMPKLLTRDEIEKLEIKDAKEFMGRFYKLVETTNKISAFNFIEKEYERKIEKELKQQIKGFELETTLYGYKPRTTTEVVSIINSGNLHLGSKEYNGKQFAGVFRDGEYIAGIKNKTEEFMDDEMGFIDLKEMRNKVNVEILETSKASMKVRLRIVS